jgi:hypothetical protein
VKKRLIHPLFVFGTILAAFTIFSLAWMFQEYLQTRVVTAIGSRTSIHQTEPFNFQIDPLNTKYVKIELCTGSNTTEKCSILISSVSAKKVTLVIPKTSVLGSANLKVTERKNDGALTSTILLRRAIFVTKPRLIISFFTHNEVSNKEGENENNYQSHEPMSTQTPTPSPSEVSVLRTPIITSISPQAGKVGTKIIITGSGFDTTKNALHFGNGTSLGISSTNNGTTITYIVPKYIGTCPIYAPLCPGAFILIQPNPYGIYIQNSAGNSNGATFTVTP